MKILADTPPTVAELLPMVDAGHEARWTAHGEDRRVRAHDGGAIAVEWRTAGRGYAGSSWRRRSAYARRGTPRAASGSGPPPPTTRSPAPGHDGPPWITIQFYDAPLTAFRIVDDDGIRWAEVREYDHETGAHQTVTISAPDLATIAAAMEVRRG